MKRAGRVIFNIVAALSAALSVFVAAVWLRSHSVTDAFNWNHLNIPSKTEAHQTEYQLCLARDAMMLSIYWHTYADFRMVDALVRTQGVGWRFSHTNPGGIVYLNPLPGSILGIGGTLGGANQTDLRIPYWLPLVICLSLPMLWINLKLRSRRQRQRAMQGQCIACGYDLRATPDQCPECGRAAEATIGGRA